MREDRLVLVLRAWIRQRPDVVRHAVEAGLAFYDGKPRRKLPKKPKLAGLKKLVTGAAQRCHQPRGPQSESNWYAAHERRVAQVMDVVAPLPPCPALRTSSTTSARWFARRRAPARAI